MSGATFYPVGHSQSCHHLGRGRWALMPCGQQNAGAHFRAREAAPRPRHLWGLPGVGSHWAEGVVAKPWLPL